MIFGVQLYGPLSNMGGGVLEDLSALARAGIRSIEPCILAGDLPLPENIFWPADWLTEHVEEIKSLGLEIPSAHVFTDDLAGALDRLKELAAKAGIVQYVVKTPEKMDGLSLQQAALTYMKAADELAGAGVQLLLHNEAGDIRTKIAGKTAYERLLDLCMGKVFAQVDVGWVRFGGEDPAEFLMRNAWRVRSVHHKDFGPGTEPADVPLGTGDVDLAACFRFAQHRDIPQLVDQEHFGPDVPGELAAACGLLNGFTYSGRESTVSYLNIYDTETGEVKTLARFDRVIEAPNWLKKSDTILFNSEGHIFRYDIASGTETMLDTGPCDRCNNDHVVSPDERYIAVSHAVDGYASRIYVVPLDGGEARLVTPDSPSYLHGWYGSELAYCAFREIDGKTEVDVYAVPAGGGSEKRLTEGGFNDGPEYSPDGKTIWFNSTRSGLMQIWRMDRGGGSPTQITKNQRNNWFSHLSPDGKKAVYLSYGPRQLEPQEHLPNMPVELWMMDADGGGQHRILSLFGGQGTMNVNSWAGDSRRFAFVSYEV